MATRNEIFPSRFLKAVDLNGKAVIVEIADAPTELLGSGPDAEHKTVLYFRGDLKPMPMNIVNWDSVASIAGPDTEDWAGHSVELFPTTTTLRGKTVDCIRIRAPRAQAPAKASPQRPLRNNSLPGDRITSGGPQANPGEGGGYDDLNDDIPY